MSRFRRAASSDPPNGYPHFRAALGQQCDGAQQWETVFHADFDEHKAALQRYLEHACPAAPLLVNSHTGKHFYSVEQNLALT